MLGLVKFLTLIAASLLLFSGVRQLNWGQSANSQNIKADIELLLQGKENIFSLFDSFPWFANAAARETEIEAAVAVTGVICLMLAARFSIAEFLGKLFLTVIFLGILFTMVGPGRQVIPNLRGSFPVPQFGSLQSTNGVSPGAISAGDGLVMEPGQWFVSGTMNGAPLGSISRCFSYGNVREMMTTGEGLVDSSCPVGLERHGNELRGFSQCALTEASAQIVLELSVHLTGDLSVTLNGKPWLAEHVEARRTGPC